MGITMRNRFLGEEKMGDLIDRQLAIDAIERNACNTQRIFDAVKALPSAAPDLSEYSDKLWERAYERGKAAAQAEIVRCKDCRFNTYSKKCLNPDSFFLVPADDFYCGYAERKTNE